MVALVTPEQARFQLRVAAGTPDDEWIALFIPVVSAAVASWLKESWRLYEPELDSAGEVVVDSNGDPVAALDSSLDPVVRAEVQGAVLLELASQYRYREGEGDNVVPDAAGHGYVLSKGATALLVPLRRSTVR